MIINLVVGLIKSILLYKMRCFSGPYSHSQNEIKVNLNLSNFATKVEISIAACLDTSTFAKVDWATVNCIIFWDFLMFYQTFLSPQVERCAIITYKYGIYESPNDLILRILGN